MHIKFDKFNRARKPSIILCNPNEDELFALSENTISDRKLTLRFNSISEFSFTAQETYADGSPCAFYDYLKTTRLVKISNIGTFSITRVIEVDNGVYKSKDVECKSIEYEIANRSFTVDEGTYKFYDTIKPDETILGIVMSQLPDWSLDTVDSDLWNVYRTFEVVESNVYDFMVSNLEEAYECIFIFNSIDRTISVTSVKNAVKPSDIFLSHKNLVKETKITEDSSEVKTALSIYGADDFSIRSVNPLGGTTIYDFSYYKNTDWMTQDLIDALDRWEQKCATATVQQNANLTQLKNLKGSLLALQVELKEKEEELKSLNNIKSVRLEQGLSVTDINAQIAQKEAEIASIKSRIESTNESIKNITNSISQTASGLSFENNFTEEQYKTLIRFIKVGTYQNDSFGVTDSMTDVEIQEIAEELLELGKEVLGRVSKPKLSFEMDAVNFLNLVGYEKFSKELELGTEITYETRDKERFAYPVLLEMGLDYDNNTEITLSFGNRLRLDKSEYTFSELFKDTINTVGDVNFNKGKWGEGVKAKNQFNEYLNNSLNASLQEIINSDNQDILIDSSGIRCRRFNPDTNDYDPEQIWITGKSIVFTDDGFKTAKTAIGNIMLPDGTKSYGINAEVLLGKLIAGSQMQIMNENMSFVVDQKGVTLKNATILVTDDNGEDVALEDKVQSDLEDAMNKASGDLADAIDKVVSDMGDMKEAIEDGMIDIFYQTTKPAKAKEGDLWFDTGVVDGKPKNEAYLYKNNQWISIKDKGIIDALDKAQNAQSTADGKITSYFQDSPPVIADKDKVNATGDIWIDTNDKNRMYRWNGSKWVDIHDGRLDSIESNLKDSIDSVYETIEEKAQAIEDGMIDIFYQPKAPTNADGKDGDLWYDTTVVNGVPKNEAYLKRNGAWVQIKDKGVIDALQNADRAQTTADGKITTFYLNKLPTKDTHPTLDEGDILIHTGEGNKMYRFNGTNWVNIQDQAINAVSKELGTQVENINKAMGDMQTAIEDGMIDIFYQARAPLASDGKNGDLWYDISTTTYVDSKGQTVTTKKNEGYLKVNGAWQPIKDKTVLEALEKAHTAQDTADGKITSYYCAQSALPLPEELCEGDLWFDTANKNKPYVRRGTNWVSAQDGTIADAQNTANNALNKVNAVTDSSGQLITGALAGNILAGKNNIICESSSTSNKVMMNEKGIVFANSKDSTGNWQWKTAISADGIEAEAIRANGVLSGVTITGGSLNIGNNAFKVDSSGNLTIANASINLGNGKFTVDKSGNITATSIALKNSSITDSELTGGSLNIGNGKFTVDKNGNCSLAGNIKMTGAITWGTSSSPVKAQYSVDGVNNWHTTVTSSDKYVKYSYDGGTTWTTAIKISGEDGRNGTDGKDGKDANLPEFITSTYIDGSRVESPILRGGLIEGATLRCIGTSKSAIEVRNASSTLAGYIKYDENGNGSTEGTNRMFICTENGYNMKLQSSANMSLSANKIYLQGTVIINGTEYTAKPVAVFG